MRKLTVLVDMDDTLEGLLKAWLEYLDRIYHTGIRYEDATKWELGEILLQLTEKQIYRPLLTNEFWGFVEPIDGAVENMKKLYDDGHDIYVVTASHYQSLKGKMERVLFKYFPFIDWDHVIITSNKQLVHGDVLIDDGVHNLIGGSYEKILMTAPHNRGFDVESCGMTRVNTWDEAYAAVCAIANREKGE